MPIVTIPAVGQYGMRADESEQELPINAWSNVTNMRMRDGFAERAAGTFKLFATPVVTPYWVAPYATNATTYVVHAGLSAVYVDDGTTRTNITATIPPTGAIDDRWTGGSLNGVLVVNNGQDVPQFWNGTGLLAAIPGWNTAWRCRVLRPFKNYMVALYVTKGGNPYPHMVKWSHACDPGAITAVGGWNEADPCSDAGEVDLAETTDKLVDCLPLGDALCIYKERSMYLMRYVGGQSIFAFQRLPGSQGCLARGCIAVTPVGHVVLTTGDLILHSGQGAQSLVSGKMRRWLFAQMDTTNAVRSFLVANAATNEVWVCFPTTGNSTCNLALVWNWLDQTFAVRDLPGVTFGTTAALTPTSPTETWSSDTQIWSMDATKWQQVNFNQVEARLVFSGGNIVLADSGTTNDGATYTASLERTGLAFDNPYSVKMLRSVYPRIDGPTGETLTIEIGAHMDMESSVTWSAPVTYTIGSTFKADSFATGRFLALRITSTSAFAWRIKSIDLDVLTLGAY